MADSERRRRFQRSTENDEALQGQDSAGRSAAPGRTAQTANPNEIDLMEFFYRFLASWKLTVLIVAACVGFAFYSNSKTVPVYRATSTIYVVDTNASISMSNFQIASYMMNDYMKVFDNWEVHQQVRDSLGLNYPYQTLRSMISVNNDSGTRMIDITATSTNPELVANVANAYAEVVSDYIADTMKMDKPSIMSVALVPTNPIGVSQTANVYRNLLIGLAISAAIVFISMLLDDKIKTADDITKYTGLPNLAVVPVDETLQKTEKRQAKAKGRKKHA